MTDSRKQAEPNAEGKAAAESAPSKAEPREGKVRRATKWLSREIAVPVAAAIVVIAFLVQAFRIPSSSMEDSLLVGDFLLGLKFVYGTPIPFSDDKLPGLVEPDTGDVIIFQHPGDPAYPDYDRGRYSHLANLLMFGNFFWDSEPPEGQSRLVHYFMGPKDFIKRCVAKSGQTVEMRHGKLYVDGEAKPIPGKGKQTDYHRQGPPRDDFGPIRIPAAGETFRVDTLSLAEKHRLRMLMVQENPGSKVLLETKLYRNGEPLDDWTFDDFRFPAQPQKGTLLQAALRHYARLGLNDTVSVPIAFSTLQKEIRTGFVPAEVPPLGGWFGLVDKVARTVAWTNFDPTQLEDLEANVARLDAEDSAGLELRAEIVVDGEPVSEYTLKQDAYFMMGDNRDNSADSRYWGLLSRANVKAKAFVIYFSIDADDPALSLVNPFSWARVPFLIRWTRIGKLIHGV